MTVVEYLETQIVKFHNWKRNPIYDENCFDEIELNKAIQQAKELEKQQFERMYSEEEARAIWNSGQEYWRTSGDSITFEELTEQFKTKYPVKTKDRILSETSEETKQKARNYGNSLVEGTFEKFKKQIRLWKTQ